MKMKNFMIIFASFSVLFFLSTLPAFSDVWTIQPDIPDYDPLWNKIDDLWNKSKRSTENMDEIINIAAELSVKYPDRMDPVIWQAWGYQQKALRGSGSQRPAILRKAIEYARKAYDIKKDLRTFKILMASTSAYKDINEVRQKHGVWIKEATPLPAGRALPELKNIPEWEAAVNSWDGRCEAKKAHQAADIFKKIAEREKGSCTAQTWVCMANYYLGQYYEFENQKDKSISYYEEAARYGKKALQIKEGDVAANYWYFVTLGKSIEYKPLYVKVLNSKDMINNILVFMFENPLYFYSNPIATISDAVVQEAFIMGNIMDIFGFGTDQILCALELSEIAFPNYFRLSLCRAKILYNIDREEEAKRIISDLLKRNPDADRLHAPENAFILRDAREFLASMK